MLAACLSANGGVRYVRPSSSSAETYPFGAALAVMAFAVLVVLLFNYHARLTSSAEG